MAIAPNLFHSSIARADYTVSAPVTAPAPQPAVSTNDVLRAGTKLRLVTAAQIDSRTAQVGDKIPLSLDQNLESANAVVIPKGTPVEGVLTIADPAAKWNVPGDLIFEVRGLKVAGISIPLSGGETIEGAAGRRPKEATIVPGMVVVVTVTADTPLKP